MIKVSALPCEMNENEFAVFCDSGMWIFKGSYHDCCELIEFYEKHDMVYYISDLGPDLFPESIHYVFLLRPWSFKDGFHVIGEDITKARDMFEKHLIALGISFIDNDIFCYSYDESKDLYNLIY